MSTTNVLAAAAAICLATATIVGEPALAQAFSAPTAQPHLTVEEAAVFARQVERRLTEQGARVAIVFRTGFPREELPEGVDYTHGAFWVHRDAAEDGRPGYAVYNLYNGDGGTLPKSQSRLVQDWPLDFVIGAAVDDVGVIIPSQEMQRRILAIIDSPSYEALHNPAYALVANPHSQAYQNCNTFMLTIIAAAAWGTEDRDAITTYLRDHFEPQTIAVGRLRRLFGPMADARLKTDDHDGPVRTATFQSMAAFMARYELARGSYVILREPPPESVSP
jgi:hypothetical protein